MSDPSQQPSSASHTDSTMTSQRSSRRSHLAATAIAGFVVLAIGAAGGATAMRMVRAAPEMAPLTPVAISAMPTWSLVTIKGKVADIYGNKFVIQDDSGKALIETGPAGDDGSLVAKDEAVTIQGRFDNGFVHASYIVHSDGSAVALGPAGGPHPHRALAELFHKVER
jgi:uncharacterized protein YdeI (BOF family)